MYDLAAQTIMLSWKISGGDIRSGGISNSTSLDGSGYEIGEVGIVLIGRKIN